MGKFGDRAASAANLASAEQALKRALAINPDLSLAHNLYAQFEVEAGRAREAMVRLLDRVRTSPSEPELFAGLVHACRYCGLLDASEAADERARRLDPHVVTSIAQTFLHEARLGAGDRRRHEQYANRERSSRWSTAATAPKRWRCCAA